MNSCIVAVRGSAAALVVTLAACAPVVAGYVQQHVAGLCNCDLCSCSVPAAAENSSRPASGNLFVFLGSEPTKWEPGANTAVKHGFSPPDGPESPGAATFSIVGAGFVDVSTFDGSHGSLETVAITELDVPGLTTVDDYAALVHWALDQWASVSGFTNLGRVADGNVDIGAAETVGGHLGDIRVAAWELVPSQTIAHGFQPGTEAEFGPGGTLSGDIHFDVNRNWVNDPDDPVGTSTIDFPTLVLHEVGHALGLGHTADSDSVMQAGYTGGRRTLGAGDIAGIRALYGVPEPATWQLLAAATSTLILRRNRCRRGLGPRPN
jgi:hypothetical protein